MSDVGSSIPLWVKSYARFLCILTGMLNVCVSVCTSEPESACPTVWVYMNRNWRIFPLIAVQSELYLNSKFGFGALQAKYKSRTINRSYPTHNQMHSLHTLICFI